LFRCIRRGSTLQISFFLCAFFFFFFSVAEAEPPAYKNVLRVRDGSTITFDGMIREIAKNDMVFVGEGHDNEKHHRAQRDIIKALHGKKNVWTVGLEMFRAENQEELNRWVGGGLDTGDFIRIYYSNWNLPWPLYRDIFLDARAMRIPLLGLNIPNAISRKISAGGFNSLSADELKKLPPGISCDMDDEYMTFVKKSYEGHGWSERTFVYFCEAQMVWDKAMAWRLLEYKKKYPRRSLVILAGAGHAWKRGIPAQVKRGAEYSVAVVLPEVPGKLRRSLVTLEDADYVLLD